MSESITIRRSTADDRAAIRRVAALDSGQPPKGDSMLALVGDEIRAVLPLAGGRALADPFHRTAELVELLRFTARGRRRAWSLAA